MISLGNKKIKDIFLGERQVKKVYLGTKEIYSSLTLSIIINNPFSEEVDNSLINVYDKLTYRIYYNGDSLDGTEQFDVSCEVKGFYVEYNIDTSQKNTVIITIEVKASNRDLYIVLDNHTDEYFEYTIRIKKDNQTEECVGSNSQLYSIPYGAYVDITYASDLEVSISQDLWYEYKENSTVYITVQQYTGGYLCQASIYSNVDLCPEGSEEEWFPSYTTITLYFKNEIIYQQSVTSGYGNGGNLFTFEDLIYCPEPPEDGDFTCSIIYEDPCPDMPQTYEFSNSIELAFWEGQSVSIRINVNE